MFDEDMFDEDPLIEALEREDDPEDGEYDEDEDSEGRLSGWSEDPEDEDEDEDD